MQDTSPSLLFVIDFHPRLNRLTLSFLSRLKLLYLELHTLFFVSSESRSFFFFFDFEITVRFYFIFRLNIYLYASVHRFDWKRVKNRRMTSIFRAWTGSFDRTLIPIPLGRRFSLVSLDLAVLLPFVLIVWTISEKHDFSLITILFLYFFL